MSSILYIGKDYCHTLEQLQDYFRHISSDQDVLYNELLTLQRDGLIVQWLEEGDAREKELADKIRNLPSDLKNTDVMEKLTEILTNEKKSFRVNFYSYLELKEVSYALVSPNQTATDQFVSEQGDLITTIANTLKGIALFKPINIGKVLSIKEEELKDAMRLKLKFKILKPEKEKFRLKAMVSLRQQTIHKAVADISLDNEPIGTEKVVYLDFPILLLKKGDDAYNLEVKSGEQMLISVKLSLGIPDVLTVNGVNFKMIKVEGGTFKMGSPKNDTDADEHERPQHEVTLKDFYIGETVVTQALWKAVMNANPSNFKGDGDLPVESVSYNDITGFLAKLNELMKDQLHGKKFALPTEEQWEFAARGGVKSKGYKYSGSKNINDVAWYGGNSGSPTHPVKKKVPNELGIYDMSGNVWEWCDSYWRSNYNANPEGCYRVTRGGCWLNDAENCRVARRNNVSPDDRGRFLGFRLVLQ